MKVKLVFPDPSVLTSKPPRKVFPSPYPKEVHDGLAKNSRWYSCEAMLLSVPVTVVVPFDDCALVSTG